MWIPSRILEFVFKFLNSQELSKIAPINKQWYEIIKPTIQKKVFANAYPLFIQLHEGDESKLEELEKFAVTAPKIYYNLALFHLNHQDVETQKKGFHYLELAKNKKVSSAFYLDAELANNTSQMNTSINKAIEYAHDIHELSKALALKYNASYLKYDDNLMSIHTSENGNCLGLFMQWANKDRNNKKKLTTRALIREINRKRGYYSFVNSCLRDFSDYFDLYPQYDRRFIVKNLTLFTRDKNVLKTLISPADVVLIGLSFSKKGYDGHALGLRINRNNNHITSISFFDANVKGEYTLSKMEVGLSFLCEYLAKYIELSGYLEMTITTYYCAQKDSIYNKVTEDIIDILKENLSDEDLSKIEDLKNDYQQQTMVKFENRTHLLTDEFKLLYFIDGVINHLNQKQNLDSETLDTLQFLKKERERLCSFSSGISDAMVTYLQFQAQSEEQKTLRVQ